MSAQITVRGLDANGDPLWGEGQGNYLSDIDAVGQIIGCRIKLLYGEWWSDLTDGTPLFQKILGVGGAGRNPEAINLVLQQRILGSAPFVTGMQNVRTSYDPNARAFVYYAEVTTSFGTVVVTNVPKMTTTPGI